MDFRGGPEPLENEINEILGSKREDRFSVKETACSWVLANGPVSNVFTAGNLCSGDSLKVRPTKFKVAQNLEISKLSIRSRYQDAWDL